jgi:hypothetical protein
MAAIPFAALSVHHFISTVGADVGFASLIGVALLVLLFFSQARETATLRGRADEAGLRIQELESEVAELAEQLAALPAEISVRAANPRVAAAFGAVQPGAGVGASALPPSAPAGMAAPALAAATRLIPDPVGSLPEYAPATGAGNGNGSSSRPVVAASAATMERPVQAPPAGTARPVAAPPRVGGGGGGRPGRGPGAGQGRPPGAGQHRPGTPRPGAPLRPPPRRSRGRMVLGAVIAAVALAAIAVGVIILAGGKSAPRASKSSTNAALATHRSTSASAVRPDTVTVSVLNGTDMSGLAGDVTKRLQAVGYRKGAVTNASDQTHTSTIVAYIAPAYRRDALAVATSLKLGRAAVQLVDPTSKATACPPAQACTSAVVVTVGQDLAQQ